MQHPVFSILRTRHNKLTGLAFIAPVLLGAALLALAGCGDSSTEAGSSNKSFVGQKLTVRCPDAVFADAITPMAKAWAERTGATVVVRREPMAPEDDSDIGLIPSGHLGAWAEPRLLLPVPTKMRASDNPFQWFGLLPAYGERLVEWGGQTLAVPLTGDGFVVVYRADRFADAVVRAEFAKQGRPAPVAPVSWEQYASIAAGFAALDKKPSLPPLPTDPERMFDLFGRVAASADREKLDDVRLGGRTDRDALAFYFSVATGEPRLHSSGFRFAAKWLEELRATQSLPPDGPDDPVAALTQGRAVLDLLSLDQLARLPREGGTISPRFGLSGIPGAFHPAEQGKGQADANPNYVPYFAGGRLGVVRSRCPHAEAAFDLLADLGGPARSAELIGTPGIGAGPMRIAHLDRERLVFWLGYGFDEERSKALQDAMRHYVEQTVKNPVLGLRGPDRAGLVADAGPALRKIGAGTLPKDALTAVETAWRARDAHVPRETLIRWRQRAVGLN